MAYRETGACNSYLQVPEVALWTGMPLLDYFRYNVVRFGPSGLGSWGSGPVGPGLAIRTVSHFRAPVLTWTVSSAWARTWGPPLIRTRNNEEEATHIIYPRCDPLEEEYARPTMRRERTILMHWYYFPDSHDTWTSVELPVEPPDSPPTHTGLWKWWCVGQVDASWVTDLDQYNEWMNEEDYEVDENGRKKIHKLRLSVEDLMSQSDPDKTKKKQKRKRSPSPPPKPGKRKSGRSPAVGPTKKHKLEEEADDLTKDLEEPLQEPNIAEVPVPKLSSSSKRDSDLQPIKGGTLADLDEDMSERAVGEDSSSQGPKDTQENSTQSGGGSKDEGPEDNVTEQTHHIIIPSYSAWFDYNSIHMVEKRALPEFFNGSYFGLLSVGFARSAIVDYPGESPVTLTSRWEGWRGRRKESRQRESQWEVGESPGNVHQSLRTHGTLPRTTSEHESRTSDKSIPGRAYNPPAPRFLQKDSSQATQQPRTPLTVRSAPPSRPSFATFKTPCSEKGTSESHQRVPKLVWLPSEPIETGVLSGAEYSGEIVTDGLENIDCGAVQAVERLKYCINAGKNKSKTPEIYLAYRNFMIDTYRLNPTEYITSTACRRNLAGDVCAIMRVHAFLEQWGLVNYQVDTPSGLQPINPPKTPQPSAAKTLLDMDKKELAKKTDIDPSTNFGLKLDQ
uniref:SWIRM domain-containing protein n=1 Tax=Timema genevievae TaxID=629358 RepID=A0A7R9JYB5_TIMGE|nr:unnamed protein product [Timema genevievae]